MFSAGYGSDSRSTGAKNKLEKHGLAIAVKTALNMYAVVISFDFHSGYIQVLSLFYNK